MERDPPVPAERCPSGTEGEASALWKVTAALNAVPTRRGRDVTTARPSDPHDAAARVPTVERSLIPGDYAARVPDMDRRKEKR